MPSTDKIYSNFYGILETIDMQSRELRQQKISCAWHHISIHHSATDNTLVNMQQRLLHCVFGYYGLIVHLSIISLVVLHNKDKVKYTESLLYCLHEHSVISIISRVVKLLVCAYYYYYYYYVIYFKRPITITITVTGKVWEAYYYYYYYCSKH